jgi:hypothetical protein
MEKSILFIVAEAIEDNYLIINKLDKIKPDPDRKIKCNTVIFSDERVFEGARREA